MSKDGLPPLLTPPLAPLSAVEVSAFRCLYNERIRKEIEERHRVEHADMLKMLREKINELDGKAQHDTETDAQRLLAGLGIDRVLSVTWSMKIAWCCTCACVEAGYKAQHARTFTHTHIRLGSSKCCLPKKDSRPRVARMSRIL